jgi:hypothetical protein
MKVEGAMSEMHRITRFSLAAALVVGLGLVAVGLPAGALSQPQLKSKAMALSDMPAGWSVDNRPTLKAASAPQGCLTSLSALKPLAKDINRVQVKFVKQQLPDLSETLESGIGAQKRYAKYLAILQRCKSLSYRASGSRVTGTVGTLSLPALGPSSSVQAEAFVVNLKVQGVSAVIDIVLFRVGQVDGQMVYADFASNAVLFQGFATDAVSKIEGKPTGPPSTT